MKRKALTHHGEVVDEIRGATAGGTDGGEKVWTSAGRAAAAETGGKRKNRALRAWERGPISRQYGRGLDTFLQVQAAKKEGKSKSGAGAQSETRLNTKQIAITESAIRSIDEGIPTTDDPSVVDGLHSERLSGTLANSDSERSKMKATFLPVAVPISSPLQRVKSSTSVAWVLYSGRLLRASCPAVREQRFNPGNEVLIL